MNQNAPETLFIEDRTHWSPRPRGGVDRRALVAVVAALCAFAGLLGSAPRREPQRPRVTRYLVARAPAPDADPQRSTESAYEPLADCSPPPAE